jgi:hypothetical protein
MHLHPSSEFPSNTEHNGHVDAMVFQKRALRWYSECHYVESVKKSLHFKAYKLLIVEGVERWIVLTHLSANVFITLATQ